MLDALGQQDLEQVEAWELNERFYGGLTGRDKDQAREEFGADQVHRWRRGYDIRPPAGESLKDTGDRALPYFRAEVVPAAQGDAVVMVAAHGNSLRAICKELDGLSDEEIPGLEIATGVPLLYDMDGETGSNKRVLD